MAADVFGDDHEPRTFSERWSFPGLRRDWMLVVLGLNVAASVDSMDA